MERRVLVLSSQSAFAELLSTALLESGKYVVTVEESAQFAENLAQSRQFDLLVLDIDLEDGELISSVISFQHSVIELRTILLVTTPQDAITDLGDLHVDRLIHKPFYLPNFLEAVELCLQTKKQDPQHPAGSNPLKLGDFNPSETNDWVKEEEEPMAISDISAKFDLKNTPNDMLEVSQDDRSEQNSPEISDFNIQESEQDTPGCFEQEFETIDRILSRGEATPDSSDLLKGLVFPWDEPDSVVDFLSPEERAWMQEMEVLEITEDVSPQKGFSDLEVASETPDSLTAVTEEIPPRKLGEINLVDEESETTPVPIPLWEKIPVEGKLPLVDEQFEEESGVASAGIERALLMPASPARTSLNYTCLLIPRFQDQLLVGGLSRVLSQKMQEICIGYGWRLDRLAIRPMHLQCSIIAPPNIAPSKIIRSLRKASSLFIFDQKPEWKTINPSKDFWAPGYLLLSGHLAPTEKMIAEFLLQTRQMQGVKSNRIG